MASRTAISGLALAEITAGLVLAYAGISGMKLSAVLPDVLKGKLPAIKQPVSSIASQEASDISGASSDVIPNSGAGTSLNPAPPSSATVAAYKAFATMLCTAHGWPGQVGSLFAIVGEEDGSWNPRAQNPSGALGIAQALGHGTAATAGSLGNEYGGYGTSDAVAKAANNGNGNAQIEWMCNYIAQTYGNPAAAQAFHLAHNYY